MKRIPSNSPAQASLKRAGKIRGDRERIFVIIAYARPPEHLCMKLAESGKVWFRRGTGAYCVEIAATLRKCGIKGRIKSTGRFLAGTPNWTPKIRNHTEGEETDPRKMSPVAFARRFKGVLELQTMLRSKGHSVRSPRLNPTAQPKPTKRRKPENPPSSLCSNAQSTQTNAGVKQMLKRARPFQPELAGR